MPSIDFNPLVPRFGRVVLRRHGDRMVFSRPPGPREGPPSPALARQQMRFGEAVASARGVLGVPARRAAYEALATSRNRPVFATIVADFLAKPVIREVDTTGFQAHAGEPLVVRTRAGLPIDKVLVALRQADDTPLEDGEAVKQADNEYRFVVSRDLPAGTAVFADVTVRDTDGISVTRSVPLVTA